VINGERERALALLFYIGHLAEPFDRKQTPAGVCFVQAAI
jgi:hypothetical protein